MPQPFDATSPRGSDTPLGMDTIWPLLLAAKAAAEQLSRTGERATFGIDDAGRLRPVDANDPDALIVWRATGGWESHGIAGDQAHTLLDLYLPICSATRAHP